MNEILQSFILWFFFHLPPSFPSSLLPLSLPPSLLPPHHYKGLHVRAGTDGEASIHISTHLREEH